MIERGSGAGLTAKAFERVGVADQFVREEFEGDEAAEIDIFGFVDHSHAAAADFLNDPIVGDGLADQLAAPFVWVSLAKDGRWHGRGSQCAGQGCSGSTSSMVMAGSRRYPRNGSGLLEQYEKNGVERRRANRAERANRNRGARRMHCQRREVRALWRP